MSGRGFIAPEPLRKCEECGKMNECRPYGKGGKWVCFQCGMKDEAEAMRQAYKYLSGKDTPI